jgi:hypothetical protein
VAFNSVENYENVVLTSDSKVIRNLDEINQSSLKQLKSTESSDGLYDDFLLSILNEDKIVQIGQWIIKVDLESEIVSALSEDNINFYNDLVNDVDNDSIFQFSTDDDVLDLLDMGVKGTISSDKFKKKWWKKCKDSRADARKSTISNVGMLTSRQELVVRYFKAGIYFTLYAKVKNSGAYFGSEDAQVTMDVEYEFDDRCDRSYSRSHRHIIKIGRLPFGNVTQNVYRHVRNLARYRLDTHYSIKYYNFYGDYIGTLNHYFTIRSNMNNWKN